jgi:hypothetical protein
MVREREVLSAEIKRLEEMLRKRKDKPGFGENVAEIEKRLALARRTMWGLINGRWYKLGFTAAGRHGRGCAAGLCNRHGAGKARPDAKRAALIS